MLYRIHLIIIILLTLFRATCQYVNLARDKTAWQSSNNVDNRWFASAAVDGDKRLYVKYNSCAITKKSTMAEWRVDLGKEMIIHYIDIYYRTEGLWVNEYRWRMAGFFLYVSNTTEREKGHLCFHEIQTTTNPPKNPTSIPCVQYGRYVIYYNERRSNVTYPPEYSMYVWNELCEVEVYACESSYGSKCASKCGKCRNREKCNPITGVCPNGCDAGWRGEKCNTECLPGTYGINCKENCSINCKRNPSNPCNKTTGECISGCNPGWKGITCTTVCGNSYYGDKCSKPCGRCLSGQTCNHVNGSCPSDCEPGWLGNKCDTECQPGRYGSKCKENCSINCQSNPSRPCNITSGECTHGCNAGWQGKTCHEVCDNSYYGDQCKNRCGRCLDRQRCNYVNGTCPFKCDPGWQGDKCDAGCNETFYGKDCKLKCSANCVNRTCYSETGACIVAMPLGEDDEGSSTIGPVIGGLVGGLIFVAAIIVFGIVYFRRLSKRREPEGKIDNTGKDATDNICSPSSNTKEDKGHFSNLYANFEEEKTSSRNYAAEVEVEAAEEEDIIYANNTVKEEVSPDISINHLEQVIKEKQRNDDEEFKEEYSNFPFGERFPCDIGKMEHNTKKNRFKTTFPYDHSRVILKTSGGNRDYINASYINGIESTKTYIATQGPKQGTVEDFWRMIWQENVKQIIMLTNLKEGIKEKCKKYWPDTQSRLAVGSYDINTTIEKIYAFFVVRQCTIKHKETKKERSVTQYHYTAWPDHGIPDTLCLVVFHRYVLRSEPKAGGFPIVVHCSAGIGRTGTYIAVDALYKSGLKSGKVNIAEYVKEMRKDRMNMVQTQEQYITVFLTLNEAFKAPVNAIPVFEFVSHFENITNDTPANQNTLRKEFQTLRKIQPKYTDSDYKLAKQNGGFKDGGISLPLDKYILYLMTSVPNRGSYINAITVPSWTKTGNFIITPYPTNDSVVDLLRVLVDHESKQIVVMDPLKEIKTSALWLPKKYTTSTINPFAVTCKSVSCTDNTETYVIELVNTKEHKKPIDVTVFAPKAKIGLGKGNDTTILREMVSSVLAANENEPITVMSRNAAEISGVFCAVFNVMQQMKLDEEVDIFTAVRLLQVRRSEFFSSMDEYQTCYQAIADHILYTSDHVYYNH